MSRRVAGAARALTVIVVAAGGLAACSSDNDSEEATEATSTSAFEGRDEGSDEASTTDDEATGDPKENGAAEAGIDLDNPPDPIGEVTLQIDRDGITQTKVEVLEAKKRGKVLLVTFRFTPEGTTSEKLTIFKALGQRSFAPALIDLEALKKYEYVPELTVEGVGAEVGVGEPLYGFTAFPPPPDDVDIVDMLVSDLAPPIEDLPLP